MFRPEGGTSGRGAAPNPPSALARKSLPRPHSTAWTHRNARTQLREAAPRLIVYTPKGLLAGRSTATRSPSRSRPPLPFPQALTGPSWERLEPVSYTHLTLPTSD